MSDVKKEGMVFFLLAHHDREHLNRCLKISFKGREIFICARCTGILAGFLIHAILLTAILNPDRHVGNILLFLLPLLPVADWTTQSLGWRESTNKIRVLTGFILGLDFTYRLRRFINNPLDAYILLSSFLYLSVVLTVALISIKGIHPPYKYRTEAATSGDHS
ncbi:MAG: putative membrane protein [Candidatus Bathyarchaeota archaeon B26-1]|nr:MAG: putative membrane protein [Candidatus Bathyarchaeota archaeon B26-1]